jgi:hypothetical protein
MSGFLEEEGETAQAPVLRVRHLEGEVERRNGVAGEVEERPEVLGRASVLAASR